MPFSSRWTVDIPRCSLPTYVFGPPTTAASPHEHKPILIDAEKPDRYFLTFGAFRLWSQRFAAGLIAAGVKPGDPVLIFSGNTLMYPVAFMGVIMSGAIFTGANPTYVAREVAYQLKNTDAKIMLCAEESLETGLVAAQEAGLSKDRVFVFDDGYASFDGAAKPHNGCESWTSLLASEAEGAQFKWEQGEHLAERTIALNYSSGTTGLPKGVEISNLNYVANTVQTIHIKALIPDYPAKQRRTRLLCFLPLYHAMGQTAYCATAPTEGIPTYIMRKFDFIKMLEAIQKFKITDLILAPPIAVAMSKHPATRKFDLSSVVRATSGAAPLGREPVQEFEALWPAGQVNLKQGYGMTEITCAALLWDPNKISTSYSVGEVVPNSEAKLVSTTDGATEVTTAGERGEIWLRAPTVMKGYWRNPKATEETITSDGWLKTGDVAFRDEDGLFYVVDRIKELIKVKGYQVAPAELEAQLLEHPSIADACVVGVQTDGTELPRAYVVNPKADLKPEDVVEYIRNKVSSYKQLTGGVKIVDAITKNPSGKILRRVYRERAAKEVGGPQARL